MYEMVLDAIGIAVEGLRRAPRARTALTVASLTLLFVSLLLWLAAPVVFREQFAIAVRGVAPGFAVFSGFLAVVALLSYSHVKIQGSRQISIELDDLRQERDELRRGLAEQPAPDVLNTIRLNLNQLNEYYVINKSQARNSFRFSVFAVVAGLVTLIAGIWYFYRRSQPNLELTIISSAAGTMVQFIGAAYFYLYRKSLEQLNFFFGQLVRMQDTMLSIRLCDEIDDPAKKVALRERIILELLARSAPILLSHDANAAKQSGAMPNKRIEPTNSP